MIDVAPPDTPLPAPPTMVQTVEAPQSLAVPDFAVVEWLAEGASCGGKAVKAQWIEPPAPTMTYDDQASTLAPVTLEFSIDAGGRPTSIRYATQAAKGQADVASLLAAFGVDTNPDLEPALAASRFTTGTPRQSCAISYTRRVLPIEAVPDLTLLRFATMGWASNPVLEGPMLKRFEPDGSNCLRTAIPRIIHYPAIDELDLPQGRNFVALYRFAIDAEGRTTALENVASDVPSEVTRMNQKAILASTYKSGASKSGCLMSQMIIPQQDMLAPGTTELTKFAQEGSDCPANPGSTIRVGAVPFPEAFQRRSIEGWAVVRFDVAEDGEVTAVTALDAEPASAFGLQAEAVLRAARGTGKAYKGCVIRVRFDIDDDAPVGVYGGNGAPALMPDY